MLFKAVDEKAIFLELRSKQDAHNREYVNLLRKYGGAAGVKQAALYEATIPAQNENNLALYNGRITWGEYNKRRLQIFRQYQAAAAGITS